MADPEDKRKVQATSEAIIALFGALDVDPMIARAALAYTLGLSCGMTEGEGEMDKREYAFDPEWLRPCICAYWDGERWHRLPRCPRFMDRCHSADIPGITYRAVQRGV